VTLPAAVVDTNVVVAAVLTPAPAFPVACILDAMLAHDMRFVLSLELLAAYRGVLLRARICRRHGLTPAEVEGLLEGLTAHAIWREPLPTAPRDPPDAGDGHLWRVLATDDRLVLFTGDVALQRAPPVGAGVLSPAGFLELRDQG